jgi:hypothetical protein
MAAASIRVGCARRNRAGDPEGSTWTTDAPFRETPSTIEARRAEGILAVEMEAAALYSLDNKRGYAVVCFAHVTNQMGQPHLYFEKGQANGATHALMVSEAAIAALAPTSPTSPDTPGGCESGGLAPRRLSASASPVRIRGSDWRTPSGPVRDRRRT